MLEIIFISAGLAMDCLAVSIAGGAGTDRDGCYAPVRKKVFNALRVGFFFGTFQALMPLIGWYIGSGFKNLIEKVDHWVAFGLLCAIGIKMIYEAVKSRGEKRKINLVALPPLLILSIATSIDALAVGISFSLLDIPLYLSIAIIGVFTFLFSVSGYLIGDKVGRILKNNVEIAGGVILIGIGIKILIEHLF
jgi:manganese efflux pump family protein